MVLRDDALWTCFLLVYRGLLRRMFPRRTRVWFREWIMFCYSVNGGI